MRRPVVYLVASSLVALLAMGAPFLEREVGQRRRARAARGLASSRVASELQAANFRRRDVDREHRGRGRRPGRARRATPQPSGRSTASRRSSRRPDDHRRRVRRSRCSQATWPGNGQTAAVAGHRQGSPGGRRTRRRAPPGRRDQRRRRRPDRARSAPTCRGWALIVVVVMLVLLFLAFGSLVLPLKAVVMNVVSLVASFGVVTWIFQEGHLSGLLGFTSPGYLDVTQPILMLGILFGLSMDYEVFLLSRIREEWDRTGDNTTAVATGLQRSGRIITSAAHPARRRDRRLRDLGHRVPEDDRHRHARRGHHRRHRGPGAPGPGHDAPARRRQLVGTRPAERVVGAARSARVRGDRRPTTRNSSPSRKASWRTRTDAIAGRAAARLATCLRSVRPAIAVIGGSGFYEFLDDPSEVDGRHAVRRVRRPPIAVGDGRGRARSPSCRGTAGGTSSRRIGSTTAPTSGRCARSAYAGCSRPCAVGSLQPELGPGRARRTRPARRPHDRPRPDLHGRRRRRTSRSPTRTARRLRSALGAARDGRRRRRHDGGRSRGRGSPPEPSRSGTPRRAGRSST